MNVERFLPRAVLVPFLAAGAMAWESVANTLPIAEAGGCSDGRAITTATGQLREELDTYCAQSFLREQKTITRVVTSEGDPLKTTAVCVTLAVAAFVAGRTWPRKNSN